LGKVSRPPPPLDARSGDLREQTVLVGQGLPTEIKSRTWSKEDALRKASLLSELLKIIGASTDDLILHEYVDLV